MTTALDHAPTDLRRDLAPGVLVDVEVPAAALVHALAWETARVWAAWAWLDDTTGRSSGLSSAPRHRRHGSRGNALDPT